jgi:PAS domain S-box-containing protein
VTSSVTQSATPQTILVVDDSPASLYTTSRILRSAGFKVIETVNGMDAVELATPEVDLIVLDIHRAEIDAPEVCRKLRARSSTAYLPIVQLSAASLIGTDTPRGLDSGADSYLPHPADPAVLVATVRALLYARQADAVRRTADHRFRAVFEVASTGIVLMDAALNCSDVNPAFCTLTGLSRAAIAGRKLSDFIAGDHLDTFRQISQALDTEGHWEGTLPIRRNGDSLAAVDWRIVAETRHGPRIAIATDVTQRHQAEVEREKLLEGERAARGEAERLNRVKDEFLATLSHELRNPLSAILGWVTVLKRTPGVTPEFLKGLEVIERNSRLQTHLIADLLDYAGMRFGKMNLDIVPIDPAAALQSAKAVVAPLAAAKSVTLEWKIEDPQARVMGDDARLQQIIWNLISNAIKFTPAEGRVTVTAHITHGQYEISVTDSGRGISAEFLPHLFDRFSQQDSGLNKSFAGLGIGLTIVKHLVEVHAGTIEARSLGEGRGARFTVRIPLTDKHPSVRPMESSAPLQGLSVLIVEDDQDTRAFISRVLVEAGAMVTEAASGDEALAAIRSNTLSVLVSDIGMAKQDGYQLIRNVREAGYGADILPAIALTAFSRAQDRADAIKAGFQLHLIKPIAADRLTTAIAALGQVKH